MLDKTVDKNNKTLHRKIKLKPADVKVDTYIDYDGEHNNTDLKIKVAYHARIPKSKTIFAEDYTQNWYEEVFIIKKVKIAVL